MTHLAPNYLYIDKWRVTMKKKDTTYRMPEGFNPHLTLDALRGLADALHHGMTEGSDADDGMSYGDEAARDGLVYLLRREMHALHDYFTQIGDITTLKLPMSEADFEAIHVRRARAEEVKEEPALYLVG
jgi:hypothetical protein